MKYMLDTNIIIYVRNSGKDASVRKRFTSHNPKDICISAITLAELEYGVSNSDRPMENRGHIYEALSNIEVLPFDVSAAAEYGEIRADLKKKGTPIGPNDLLIAAHAKSLGLTLVTNNDKEFKRVKGLKVENWV